MPNNDSLPFYAKFSFNLITIVLLGTIIFLGQDIFMPLCFAIVLAFLLLPVNKWLVKKRPTPGSCDDTVYNGCRSADRSDRLFPVNPARSIPGRSAEDPP